MKTWINSNVYYRYKNIIIIIISVINFIIIEVKFAEYVAKM